jgi:hypothetical protein
MLLVSFCEDNGDLVPFLEQQFPVIEKYTSGYALRRNRLTLPRSRRCCRFSETFQSKIVSFLKQRYPQIWIIVTEYVRGEILAHRPTATGIDVATEMLASLIFLDPMRDATRFWKRFRESASGLRFFITHTGHMGMGPEKIREGNWVAVLAEVLVPIILRHVESVPNKYQVIGPCYINGIMNGEVIENSQKYGNLNDCEEKFVLV